MDRIPLSRCRLRIGIIGSHKFSIIVRLPRLGSAREEDVVVALVVVVVVAGLDTIQILEEASCAAGELYYLNRIVFGRVRLTSQRARVYR